MLHKSFQDSKRIGGMQVQGSVTHWTTKIDYNNYYLVSLEKKFEAMLSFFPQ